MENLNADQIVKALECCTRSGKHCTECVYFYRAVDDICAPYMIEDALALIKELTEKVENYRNELGEVRFALAEANNDKKELTEENASLKQAMEHEHASFMEIFGQYGEKCDRLTEENERLRAEVSVKKKLLDKCVDLEDKVKSDTVSELQTRFAIHYGTYTDKDMTPITEVFRLLDQIAKELMEGKDEHKED